MPITFVPSAGDVLLCEWGPDPRDPTTFPLHAPPVGVAPEFYKRRHAAVLSASATGDLVLVAPFSTVPPVKTEAYHHRIAGGAYPFFDAARDSWLKGDSLTSVSRARLDRLYFQGRYQRARLNPADTLAVRAAILNALALGRLIPHL